ncbi:MAG: hypothetical protein Q7J05_06510 [Paludibacter sp.]|nr:hypothetical protein [Paludibacter sp.]
MADSHDVTASWSNTLLIDYSSRFNNGMPVEVYYPLGVTSIIFGGQILTHFMHPVHFSVFTATGSRYPPTLVHCHTPSGQMCTQPPRRSQSEGFVIFTLYNISRPQETLRNLIASRLSITEYIDCGCCENVCYPVIISLRICLSFHASISCSQDSMNAPTNMLCQLAFQPLEQPIVTNAINKRKIILNVNNKIHQSFFPNFNIVIVFIHNVNIIKVTKNEKYISELLWGSITIFKKSGIQNIKRYAKNKLIVILSIHFSFHGILNIS